MVTLSTTGIFAQFVNHRPPLATLMGDAAASNIGGPKQSPLLPFPSFIALILSPIGVTFGGYGGYAYPHFLEWGYRTPPPYFSGAWQKNNSDCP